MLTENKIVTNDKEISNQTQPLVSIIDAIKDHESIQKINVANFHHNKVFRF